MGLFGQKGCPQEEEYFKIYGIPAPEKWKSEDCRDCQFQENDRCQYKKAMAGQTANLKRGQPVLIKRVNLSGPPDRRRQAESDSLKKAGYSTKEQTEYLEISAVFDVRWEAADDNGRRELLEHLDQWKVHLEKGLAPQAAWEQVREWLRQREEFRRSE